MSKNRCTVFWVAVLAYKTWAGTGDTAGLSSAITQHVNAYGRTECGDIPLISAAWRALPPERVLPCDPNHLVVILDFPAFLKTHPDLASHAILRERTRQAFAFTITAAWPIYINLGSHLTIVDAYKRYPWVAFMVAGVLAHETVHAMGNLSEASGLLTEFQLDRRFQREGQLPETFDIPGLELQYREAVRQENASRHEKSARLTLRHRWSNGGPAEETAGPDR
jgi:hypothetical protein